MLLPELNAKASFISAKEKVELLELLSAVGTSICQDFGAAATGHGLTYLQVQVITYVSECSAPMREIADRLGCDASNITGIADRLEAGGFVRREVSLDDRRVKHLTATQAGRDAIHDIRAKMQMHVAIEVLSPDERQLLLSSLLRLRHAMSIPAQTRNA